MACVAERLTTRDMLETHSQKSLVPQRDYATIGSETRLSNAKIGTPVISTEGATSP
jgi:hypothetical protein